MKKLQLSKETIRDLTAQEMTKAAGGYIPTARPGQCLSLTPNRECITTSDLRCC